MKTNVSCQFGALSVTNRHVMSRESVVMSCFKARLSCQWLLNVWRRINAKHFESWQHPNVEVFSLQTSVQVSEVPDDDSEAGIGAVGQAFLEAVSLVRKTSVHFC